MKSINGGDRLTFGHWFPRAEFELIFDFFMHQIWSNFSAWQAEQSVMKTVNINGEQGRENIFLLLLKTISQMKSTFIIVVD